MKCKGTPLIKERRSERLFKSLLCIDNNRYNRSEQVSCVLKLYDNAPKNKEKSIFRGMVIPTLGKLGLILDYGKMVKPSENGRLLLLGKLLGNDISKFVEGQILADLDLETFHFLDIIEKEGPEKLKVMEKLLALTTGDCPDKQKLERVNNWLTLLDKGELVKKSRESITLNLDFLNTLHQQNEEALKKIKEFRHETLSTYSKLAKETQGIVDIEEIRIEVCGSFLKKYNRVVTKRIFDQMLSDLIREETKLIITLGHSMGKGEKLLKMDGEYYRTIYIRKG